MIVPDDLLYTESHEWIKREGDNIRVGITDHAQSELTDVVYVELPKPERQVNAKEPIAVVESVKIFVLKIENPDDLKNLKDASAYKQQIG